MSDFPKRGPRRRPLDDRLADKGKRDDDAVPEAIVRSRAMLRVDRPEELAVVAVGAMVLAKAEAFSNTRLFSRAIDSLLARSTADLTPEEVMRLEVEAYAIVDWLIGGEQLADDGTEAIARRDGDTILYDPTASVVELVQRAIDESFDLKIDYFSRRRGEMNTRRITPFALDAETYVRAYCHARSDNRVFRLNRITRSVPVKGRPIEVRQTPAKDAGAPDDGPIQISLLDD